MKRPRLLTRGLKLALTVVGLAALAAPTAMSRPSYTGVNEVLKVEFGVGYEVAARIEQGDRNADCTGWRELNLTDEVNAASGLPAPSKIDTIKGGFTDFNALPLKIQKQMGTTLPWVHYNFSAVGAAHGTVLRRRIETGVDKDCSSGSPVVTPFTPPPNDCGTRSLKTPSAALMAERRDFDGTLKSLLDGTNKPAQLTNAITFTLTPPRPLYRSCELPELGVPEYPFAVGLVLPATFVVQLAHLRLRGIAFYRHDYAGDCSSQNDSSTRCTYHVDLHVHILRVA